MRTAVASGRRGRLACRRESPPRSAGGRRHHARRARPSSSDVVCIATCGGVHKATTDSKVQLTGQPPRAASPRSCSALAGRRAKLKVKPGARPASHSVTAKVPSGAATGRPKVTDSYDNSSTSPTKLRIVSPDQIPDSGASSSRASPRSPAHDLLLRHPEAAGDVHVHQHAADRRPHRRREAKRRTVVDSWIQATPRSRTRSHGDLERAVAGHEQAGLQRRLQVPHRPGERRRLESASDSAELRLPPLQVPGARPRTPTATASARRGPATPTRARTCWRPAAPSWWRPAAAASSGRPTTVGGRQLRRHRRQGHRPRLRLHAPEEALAAAQGRAVRTGEKIGIVGETGDATGLPPALRGVVGARLVRGRALHEGGHESTSRSGTPGADRRFAPRLRRPATRLDRLRLACRWPRVTAVPASSPRRGRSPARGRRDRPALHRGRARASRRRPPAPSCASQGSGLKHVTEVSFRGRRHRVAAEPTSSGRTPGAGRGPPRSDDWAAARHRRRRPPLHRCGSACASSRRASSPSAGASRCSTRISARTRPSSTAAGSSSSAYRFQAYAPVNVTVKLVRGGRTVQDLD